MSESLYVVDDPETGEYQFAELPQPTIRMRIHPTGETEALRVESAYPMPSRWKRWVAKTFLGVHWEKIEPPKE